MMPKLTACPHCDLLVETPDLDDASADALHCPRCDERLQQGGERNVDAILALASAGLVLLGLGVAFPLLDLAVGGQSVETTIIGAAAILWREHMPEIAALVILTTVLLPLAELVALLWLVWPLKRKHRPAGFAHVFRAFSLVRPWAMSEVFILGILIAMVKLSHLAALHPGAGAWSYGALMATFATLGAIVEPQELWHLWEKAQP